MKQLGPVVPIVTPCRSDGSINQEAMQAVCREMLAAGARGFFVAGSTGRGPWFSRGTRQELCQAAAETIPAGIPLMAGCMASGLPEMLENARAMADAGAQIAIATVPGYFHYNHQEIETIFLRFADNSPIPVVVYDIPEFTSLELNIDTVMHLAAHGNIVGFKDSSADDERFRHLAEMLQPFADFYLMQGKEHFLAEALRLGASGFIVSLIHLTPAPFSALYQAVLSGKANQAEALQQGITRCMAIVRSAIKRRPESSTLFHMLNFALQQRGTCSNIMLDHEGEMPAWLKDATQQAIDACHSGLLN